MLVLVVINSSSQVGYTSRVYKPGYTVYKPGKTVHKLSWDNDIWSQNSTNLRQINIFIRVLDSIWSKEKIVDQCQKLLFWPKFRPNFNSFRDFWLILANKIHNFRSKRNTSLYPACNLYKLHELLGRQTQAPVQGLVFLGLYWYHSVLKWPLERELIKIGQKSTKMTYSRIGGLPRGSCR